MIPDFLVSRKPFPLQEVQTFLPVPRHTGQVVWVFMVPMPAEGSMTGLTIMAWPAAGCAGAGAASGVPLSCCSLPQAVQAVSDSCRAAADAFVLGSRGCHVTFSVAPGADRFAAALAVRACGVSVAAKAVVPAAAMIASAAKQAAANFFI